MKKKLLCLISLLVAFIMSFSLIACNNDKGPDGPDGPDDDEKDGTDKTYSLTVERLANSVDKFMVGSYKGSIEATISSDNVNETKYTVSIEKRGDELRVIYDKTDAIVNLKTGYAYVKVGEGDRGYQQALPAGQIDYIVDMYKDAVKDIDKTVEIKSEDGVEYDNKTNTLKLSVDAKDAVNGVLGPVQEAYKDNQTLKWLLNEYLETIYPDSSDPLHELLGDVVKFVDDNKDVTVGSLLTLVDVSLDEILDQVGLELPAWQLTKIKNRKLGEALMGLVGFLEDSDNLANIMEGAIDVDTLIDAMFFDEVNTANLKSKLETYTSAIELLASRVEIKTTLDNLMTQFDENPIAQEVFNLVKNEFGFTKLSSSATIAFDDDYLISSFEATADAAHNYTGNATSMVLGDNNYHAYAKITITEYMTDAAPFEFEFVAAEEAPEYDRLVAVVPETVSGDVSVYYETAGRAVTVTIDTVYYTTDSGSQEIDKTKVAYSADTKSFVFDGATVGSVLEQDDFTGAIVVETTVAAGDAQTNLTVQLTIMQ